MSCGRLAAVALLRRLGVARIWSRDRGQVTASKPARTVLDEDAMDPTTSRRHPDWIRVRMPGGDTYNQLKLLMRDETLHTVCEEARCPNIGECWSRGTATFMILGDICTRSCGFCAVKTGRPGAVDTGEPRRVALAIQRMGLRHAVITSVNRDELP